ncbi:hypothetical protein [Streptomyces platensis]|uniref:hypothetical protein n=1 Tax=Streptomyces platensis TaxID=58346 RepID=UPI0038700363|nr:hypothetical protein OG962_33105 [Streptomyces platensis]
MTDAVVLAELRAGMPWPGGKVYGPEAVADRLVRGVESRARAIYAPPWVRAAQVLRAGLPSIVTHWFRNEPPSLESHSDGEKTGLVGAGGRADEQRPD